MLMGGFLALPTCSSVHGCFCGRKQTKHSSQEPGGLAIRSGHAPRSAARGEMSDVRAERRPLPHGNLVAVDHVVDLRVQS